MTAASQPPNSKHLIHKLECKKCSRWNWHISHDNVTWCTRTNDTWTSPLQWLSLPPSSKQAHSDFQVKWCGKCFGSKNGIRQHRRRPHDRHLVPHSKIQAMPHSSQVMWKCSGCKNSTDAHLMTATWYLAEQLRKCWPRTPPLWTHPIFTTPFYVRSSKVDQSISVIKN